MLLDRVRSLWPPEITAISSGSYSWTRVATSLSLSVPTRPDPTRLLPRGQERRGSIPPNRVSPTASRSSSPSRLPRSQLPASRTFLFLATVALFSHRGSFTPRLGFRYRHASRFLRIKSGARGGVLSAPLRAGFKSLSSLLCPPIWFVVLVSEV
jgi:hypothetical protein